MNRCEFLKRSLIAVTILCAKAATCDPHPADIRIFTDHQGAARSGTVPLDRLPAGQTITRRYTLFNGEASGARLQVKVQPKLRPEHAKASLLPAITRIVTVPGKGQAVLPVEIALPQVPVNTLLELTVSVTQNGEARCKTTSSFLLVPPGVTGAQAVFLSRDDRTRGNWQGIYGKEAFFLPIRTGTASFSAGVVSVDRGPEVGQAKSAAQHPIYSGFEDVGHMQSAFEVFDKASTVNDPRIPFGGNGLTTRDPIAFSTQPHGYTDPKRHTIQRTPTPILLRVDSKDAKPYRLSLYFVDYNRAGRTLNIALYDRQGHLLASQPLANYGDGAHLCFRFMGNVIAFVTSRTSANPTLSGAFVDPDTGEGLLR